VFFMLEFDHCGVEPCNLPRGFRVDGVPHQPHIELFPGFDAHPPTMVQFVDVKGEIEKVLS
jgi:hypothetical protein